MEKWLEDMIDELVDIYLQIMEEYDKGLSYIYDGLNDEKLRKAYTLLKVLEEKWCNDEHFDETTYEVIQLKTLVKRPFKHIEWKGRNSKYPTMPAEDLAYVEKMLKQAK